MNPSTPTLHELLDRNLGLAPEYGGGLSNHLPMALHALHGLGASDERLRGFFAAYAGRLSVAPPCGPVEIVDDWHAARGQPAAFPTLRAWFARAIDRDGLDAVLRSALRDLWPGVAAAALHGLIRTAHAVQAGHRLEAGAALAYWASQWMVLPEVGSDADRMPLQAWARALEAAAARTRVSRGLISRGMLAAAARDDYRRLAGALRLEPGAPLASPALGEWAASLYARSGNFTVLHVVTGLRAVRVLDPWIEDRTVAARHVSRAVTAAVLSSGLVLRARPADEPRPWPAIRAAAAASDDEHVVKLVHALDEERRIHGEGSRRAAALRILPSAQRPRPR